MSRPTYHVVNNGRKLDEVKDWKAELSTLQSQLTGEEKKSPFAKYYYRDIVMPPIEDLALCDAANEQPAEFGLLPNQFVQAVEADNRNKLKTGYVGFEDGTGFSMSRIYWPGVTDEKLEYFNANFNPEGDLFYKIWFPGLHLRHFDGAAIEDVGAGMELVHFTGGTNVDGITGIKGYEIKDKSFINLTVGCGVSYPLCDLFKKPRYAVMASYYRDLDNEVGREIFIGFWQGWTIKDGTPVRAIPEDEVINIEHIRVQANHAIWEYTQMGYLINKFWEDNH